MRTAAFTAALLSISSVAFAQAPNLPLVGFMHNLDSPALGDGLSLFIRGAQPQEELLQRIDSDDYIEWSMDSTGQVAFQGLMFWITDANDQTQETFSLVVYPEDAAMPDFPDRTQQALNVPVQMPPPAAQAGLAYRLTIDLNQPVTLPAGTDVFIGFELPAMASTQPADGLFVGSTSNDATVGSNVFDLPGPRGQIGAGIGQDSYVCYVVGGMAQYLPPAAGTLEQLALDVKASGGGVGGVAIAQTPQTSFPTSNAPQATGNMLSGLHPDIPRGDNIGFAMTADTSQVPAGSIGFVLMALGPSIIGSTPIQQLIPGTNSPDTSGNVCIDFTSPATFLTFMAPTTGPGAVANSLVGQVVVPLNAQTRAVIASLPGSLDVWWQGFVIDSSVPGPLEVRASGCVVQKIK